MSILVAHTKGHNTAKSQLGLPEGIIYRFSAQNPDPIEYYIDRASTSADTVPSVVIMFC